MATGVKLPTADEMQAAELRMAVEQRKLLQLALHGDQKKPEDRRHPDEAAAIKLLYYFSQDMIVVSAVKEAVMEGAREVAAYVANQTILHGNQPNVRPLMYFLGVDSDYSSMRKNKKNERLTLAAAFNDPHVAGHSMGAPRMTLEEAEFALTRDWLQKDAKDPDTVGDRNKWPGRKNQKDWPKSVKAAERKLVEYVKARHSAKDEESCRSYVHASLWRIAWHEDAAEDFPYPPEWSNPTP